MKTDKNFRLSKSTKRTLALMPQEKRNAWKRLMIDAEACEALAKLARPKDNKN